ncbi:MAG: hypothetical protein K6E69_00775 [Treponema sp.]|uniref:P83/100 family protein n=1 Tax=Treponema sp. TaxID=166 RepID=UPI00298DC3A3|nr:P83/100 family protein [Treponema sp.]MCR5385633.1 hypothetical protein [Treponema sp.]
MRNNFFTKKLAGVLVFTFVISTAFCLDVDEVEIKSTQNQTIVFENYTGPHKVVDSLEAIKGIGDSLGNNLEKEKSSTRGNPDKYYIIHCYDQNEGKLNADILVIGKDAGVDHIRNLRHIIASYMSKAYGYSYDDAYTLATFVTVYNAVYRKNLDYFKSKYKDVVIKNLSEDKAGLAISWKEWAGNSQIVIPLSDVNGGLSTVDTSVISDKNVVNSMKEEDDKGIDERKNMVDIKEREAETAQEKANDAQKEATKQEEKLKEEKKELAQKKEEAQEAQKKADDAKQKAEENPKDKQAKKDAEEAQKKADEKKTEVAKQEEKVEKQKEKTEEAKSEAQKEQAKSDKKQTEAQTERKEIAKDQKEVIQNKETEAKNGVYALKLVDSSSLLSTIVKVNKEDGKELKTSSVKVIRNRVIFNDGNNFIAIAGQTSKKGAVKLVHIDKDNLEIVGESEEVIADQSVLTNAGSDYYCVINDNGKYFTGRFNSSLKCTAKSNVEVNPATPIVVTGDGIFVTDKSGKARILSSKDLN